MSAPKFRPALVASSVEMLSGRVVDSLARVIGLTLWRMPSKTSPHG